MQVEPRAEPEVWTSRRPVRKIGASAAVIKLVIAGVLTKPDRNPLLPLALTARAAADRCIDSSHHSNHPGGSSPTLFPYEILSLNHLISTFSSSLLIPAADACTSYFEPTLPGNSFIFRLYNLVYYSGERRY